MLSESAISNIVVIFFASSIIIFCLSFFIIYLVMKGQKSLLREQVRLQKLETDYQKELLGAIIYTQEKERKRIAKDLHDEIGASLSTIKIKTNIIKKHIDNPEKITHLVKDISNLVLETNGNTRRISYDLLPPSLEKLDIKIALEELFNKVNDSEILQIEFKANGIPDHLSRMDSLNIYRIAQEMLNNTLKYARASKIIASLNLDEEESCFFYSDNGIGFNYEEARKTKKQSLGLSNIESRAQLLNANLNVKSDQNGTIYQLTFPVKNEQTN